jgi:hypothetical protein
LPLVIVFIAPVAVFFHAVSLTHGSAFFNGNITLYRLSNARDHNSKSVGTKRINLTAIRVWKLWKDNDMHLGHCNLLPSVTIEWVALWLRVLEVLGSSCGPETCSFYRDVL